MKVYFLLDYFVFLWIIIQTQFFGLHLGGTLTPHRPTALWSASENGYYSLLRLYHFTHHPYSDGLNAYKLASGLLMVTSFSCSTSFMMFQYLYILLFWKNASKKIMVGFLLEVNISKLILFQVLFQLFTN